MRFFTYEDAIQHLIDFLGGGSSDVVLRDCRRAIQRAYLDIANAHNWSYLYRAGRLITSPPVSDATVAYTHTGGTYERQMTLTPGVSGAAWPTWAAFAYVRVGSASYRVERRVSGTVCTLDDELNPGADLPALTPCVVYRDTYPLPEDFIAQDQALYERNFGGLSYVHPREWLFESRYVFSQGTPASYTVIGDPRLPGRLTFRCYPSPSDAKSIDFLYKRRPRVIALYQQAGGTATVTSGSTSVVGSGTAFTPQMVGSVVRLSSGAAAPTGVTGKNPPAFESAISAYTDATHVEVYDPAPFALAGVNYSVSDPADIEPGVMLTAFQRWCEMELAVARNLKEKDFAVGRQRDALRDAQAADSRSFQGRHEGDRIRFRQRFKDMPVGPDQS